MKIMLYLLVILLNVNAFSWEAFEHWNEDLQQVLIVNCRPDEVMCNQLCMNEIQCQIQTDFCKDCVGAGLLLSFFYQNVGTWFLNSGRLINEIELAQFLQRGKFILLSFDSPYNIFSPINNLRMERAFNNLCPDDLDPFPLVLGSLNHSNELSSIEVVVCHGEAGARAFFISDLPPTQVYLGNELYSHLNGTLYFETSGSKKLH